ncbi:MAG: TIR domain-containing protein [Pseudomonadota bacterium]
MSATPQIFLSYSREDQAIARRFALAFGREGFNVWWDASLRSGEDYDAVTEKALRDARAVVVLWSRQSVASRWVRTEATIALQNRTLMPVMIEPCQRPIMFELSHTADLSKWNGAPNDPAWRSFATDVRRMVDAGTSSVGTTDADSSPNQPPLPAGGQLWNLRRVGQVTALTLLALLVGAGIYGYLHFEGEPGVAVTPGGQAIEQTVSLAVLPFANLSADTDQEYFSDGLTEELLNQLAQVKALRVTGRTSSFSFKGRNEDLRIIGQKLDVNHLLEGSVRRDGNQLRITAQLINAADGSHLWSQSYDRELRNVFAVQEEIAKDVAKALSVRLDLSDLPRAQGGTTNVDAYDRYLEARAAWSQGGPMAVSAAKVEKLARESVELDSGFGAAWIMLRTALAVLQEFDPERSRLLSQEMVEIRARIIALAPDAPGTQLMIANELQAQHKWAEAEAVLRTVSVVGVGADEQLAEFLAHVGRAAEALQIYERVVRREPLSRAVSESMLFMLFIAHRQQEAWAETQRSRTLPGDHRRIEYSTMLQMLRNRETNRAALEAQIRLVQSFGPLPTIYDQRLLDQLDDPGGARQELQKAYADPVHRDTSRIGNVIVYADAFDDRDLALEAMRRMTVERNSGHQFMWMPYRTSLRADPRFKLIVRELKLDEYWRSTGNWSDYCKPLGNVDFECR